LQISLPLSHPSKKRKYYFKVIKQWQMASKLRNVAEIIEDKFFRIEKRSIKERDENLMRKG